jgi:hypothetical protein
MSSMALLTRSNSYHPPYRHGPGIHLGSRDADRLNRHGAPFVSAGVEA